MTSTEQPKLTAETIPTAGAAVLVTALVAAGYTPQKIAMLLPVDVSWRTIYRWGAGDTDPQRQGDLDALRNLAAGLLA